MRRILLFPDPTDGGDPAPGPVPPAAKAVLESDAKESDAAELVELRRKLQDAEKAKKDREVRLAELEDENRRLKTPPSPAVQVKRSFLSGATFFEGAD